MAILKFTRPEDVREQRPGEIIGQIYPASFNDSNGDGLGDLNGITAKLDYLKANNYDCIWISPFYLSPPGPEGDGGYAVTDYRSIDPRFGDENDFRRLLDEAHKRDIRVYIDFVIAHTADDHEWFEKSRRREEPYSDYYVWSPGIDWYGQKAPPNNWKSVFGGNAWTWDEERQEYYLHHFLKSQPALNLRKPEVAAASIAEMKFWLDMGVDGYRIDALPFAICDGQLRNNPWRYGTWPNVIEDWNQQQFEHSICQPEMIDLIRNIRQSFDAAYADRKITTLAEVTAGPDGGGGSEDVAASYVNREEGLDMCYTTAFFSFTHGNNFYDIQGTVRRIAEKFPDGGHCNTISNHDVWRAYNRMTDALPEHFKEAGLRQQYKLMTCLPGSLCIYQGEELGLPQALIPQDIAYDKLKDPVSWTRGPHESRDGSRTPMPWAATAKNAGFSTADEIYLPIPYSHLRRAVDRQEADPDSMLNFTRRMLEWRKEQPALIRGQTFILDTPEPILAFIRQSRDQVMLCTFNLSAHAVQFKPSDFLDDEYLEHLSLNKDEVLTLDAYGSAFGGANPVNPAVRPNFSSALQGPAP